MPKHWAWPERDPGDYVGRHRPYKYWIRRFVNGTGFKLNRREIK